MQWITKGLTFVIPEPYKPGHICTSRDAKDLNLWHCNRVRKAVEHWMRRNGRPTQEELNAFVEEKERELREKRPSKTAALSGLEAEIEEEARRSLEGEGISLTQEERRRAMERLRGNQRIVQRASLRYALKQSVLKTSVHDEG